MKKGFTLVELMGVIVLLSILIIIAVPAVTGVLKENKDKLYDSQIKTIETAAKNWASDEENLPKLPSNGKCIIIYISTLKKGGYLDLDIKNPKTEKPFSDNFMVMISRASSGKKLSFTADQEKIATATCDFVS